MARVSIASTLTAPVTKEKKIELFFRDPGRSVSGPPGYISTLYLLRNDMKTMKRVAAKELLWFRAMGVLTGIDLVSKFYSSKTKQIDRFVDFLSQYVFDSDPPASRQELGEAVYYLRNALLHSFSLHNETRSGSTTYKFEAVFNTSLPLITVLPAAGRTHKYKVNLAKLETKFQSALRGYGRDARRGTASFDTNIFDKYGMIKV